jgi:hypothetical protein
LKLAARRDFTKATSAVITVGDGRGFVVNQPYGVGQIQLVITAAHCLPFFPPCASASYLHERTFQNILAPLGAKPYVWAECLFVDPIGDIAVLGSPDDQELAEKAEAYCELVEADSVTPLPIASPSEEGWLLSLDGNWFRCEIGTTGPLGSLWIIDQEGKFIGGMSGSQGLAGAFVKLLEGGGDDDIEFALHTLHNYRGEATLHPVAKAIVVRLPGDDKRLDRVEILLENTGSVQGEFGMVEVLRERKALMVGWLDDRNALVKGFAERAIRRLDNRIAMEQRSAEMRKEQRKRDYK